MNNAIRIYALGALLLGLIGLVWADFALQWQPVPATIPARTLLAYLSAGILLVAGATSLVRRSVAIGVATLSAMYTFWTLVLHGPIVAADPTQLGSWNGFCETAALASAGLVAYASTSRLDKSRSARLVRGGQLVFGATLFMFGTCHFVYAAFTASMIPAWIPAPLFFAYFTGCGHIAAGISILTGFKARLGASLLGTMFAGFVLLLHIPRVVAAPASQIEWTMLGIALSLTGAAWIIAASIGSAAAAHSRD